MAIDPTATGRLRLEFTRAVDRTVLQVRQQTGPLKVIRAFETGDGGTLVHLHNVSGGVLGGDTMHYEIDVQPGAQVQLTTTSATRVYRRRSESSEAVQYMAIGVGENALLELLPDPIIPFAGSAYRQETYIGLAEGAGLFWWETITPGREARGECFEYEKLDLCTSLSVGQRPIAIEHARLEPQLRPLTSLVRLGQYRYFSTFYICKVGVENSRWATIENELNVLALERSEPNQTVWGVSVLVAHGLIVRCLSRSGRTIAPGLLAFWQAAKHALYERDALPPRKIY